ncbi:uncharacterized protein LOC135098882 isoform X1 [Scylla paramamosain]|uniref:uncharacterized protein LOC135098882 isoform X1 n=1 Tax=Scylla paramamosain TaxID=85552 RepID=UPI003083277D
MVVVQVKPLQPLPDKSSTLTVAANTQGRMVWWTRGCRETADRMEATDERRAGQAIAADRQTETDWIRKYYYLVRQAHWKLSVCCGTWQEPSVEEHTLSLHQSADCSPSQVWAARKSHYKLEIHSLGHSWSRTQDSRGSHFNESFRQKIRVDFHF